jgi:hypothetical protein
VTWHSERTGIENKWFALTGRVVAVKVEADGDLHIALSDATGDKRGTVVCEVPAKPHWCTIRKTVASRDELKFPPMHQMREDIKKAYGDESDPEQMRKLDEFFQYVKEAWRTMSSYTHSGGLQIGRRFTEDKVKPNYSEGEMVEALSMASVALLLLHMFFISMDEEFLDL